MMRLISLASFGAAISISFPALGQDQPIGIGPPPAWVRASEPLQVPDNATGLVFARLSDVLVHLSEDGQSTYQGHRMRLLHPQALDAGNLAITWNPAAGSPTVHTLRIHRGSAVIDVLSSSTFEVVRREDQLEQAMLDGLLTAVLRVPDLRVGDELEWTFTTPSHDPTLQEESFGLLALAPAPPAGRFHLRLSWEPGFEPAVRLTDDLAGEVERADNWVGISLDNPAMLGPPKDAPPRYSWQRITEYSDMDSWSAVSRRFAGLYETASRLAADSSVKEEAALIASTYSGDLDRAQAALELVQQQVRYIYVGMNGGNLEPATADETWQRRYGDCKGKTVLLLALLHELGIEAEAVLANNSGFDDGLDARLPNPAMFDHVLVRANIDGSTYWLDGTLPAVVGAVADPIVPYRWVLPLSEQGSALEAVPQRPFALPQEMGLYEIDARAGFDEPARFVHTTVTRGIEGLAQYMQFSTLSPDQLETGLRNALTGEGSWDVVEDVAYRYDSDTQASVLTVTGLSTVDWDDEGNGRYDLSLPGGGFNPPGRRQRASGDDQEAPFYTQPSYTCYATTVRLPEETEVENWGYNSTFDSMIYGSLYYRMMERRDDGTIRMVRGSRVEEAEISPERATRDNGRLSDFDNSMANISYNPDRISAPRGNLRSVPATYEIDWTGRDVPCLPEDEL